MTKTTSTASVSTDQKIEKTTTSNAIQSQLGDVQAVAPVMISRLESRSDWINAMMVRMDQNEMANESVLMASNPEAMAAWWADNPAFQALEESETLTFMAALGIAGGNELSIEELLWGSKAPKSEIIPVGSETVSLAVAGPTSADMLALQDILANMEPASGESSGAGRAGGSGFGSMVDPAILLGLDRLGGILSTSSGLSDALSDRRGGVGGDDITIRSVSSMDVNIASSFDDDMVFDGSTALFGAGNVLLNDISTSGALTLKTVTLNGVGHNVPDTGVIEIVGTMGRLSIGSNGDYTYTPLDAKDLGADISGIDLFEYTAEDAAGLVTTATLAVTVNDKIPVAVDDVIAADHMNLTKTGTLLSGDQLGNGTMRLGTVNGQVIDPEGITIDRPDLGYRIVIAADGSYTMTAANLKAGTDTITYSTIDADGDVSGTATVAISFADTAPALTSKAVASTNMTLVTTGSILSASDTVGDGAVRVGSVSGQLMPADGSLVLDTNDYTLTIQSNGDYRLEGKNGRTATNIQIPITTVDSDGDVSNTAVITVSVRDRVPEVMEESTTVRGGLNVATQAITGTINGVLVPDTAGDGAHLYDLISPTQGRFGTITLGSDGYYRYDLNSTKDVLTNTPDLFEKISYRVTDEDGDTSVSDLYIVIDSDGSWTVANLLPNGVDETVTLEGTLNVATQQIAGSITGNVLSNGDTVGNNPAVVTLNGTGQGLFGSIVINANGSYTYTLDGRATKTSLQGPLVNETFIYEITDADGDISTAVITIQIRPDGSWSQNNFIPVASGEIVDIDGSLNIATQRVTATISGTVLDDQDHLGDGLARVELVGSSIGSHGQLTLNADGSYSYALDDTKLNLQGTPIDNFTYRIIDRDGDVSNTVTLTVRIGSDGSWSQSNLTPIGIGESVSVEGSLDLATQQVTGTKIGSVLSNGDTLGDGLSHVELVSSGVGAHGTLTLNADGTYSYALNDIKQNLQGTPADTFTYRIIDRDGDISNTVTLTVTIGSDGSWSTSNNLVSANSESETLIGTLSGARVVGTLSGKNVTANDDLGDAPARVALEGSATGKFGSIVLNSDGTYTYTLNADKNAMRGDLIEQFTYRITDKDGDTSTATLMINITSDGTWVSDNTAPVAIDGNGGTSAGEVAITGNIISSLVTGGNGTKTISGISINGGSVLAIAATDSVHAGTFGTLTIRADGTYSYVGKDDLTGTDVITYTVRDQDGDTSTARLSLVARDLDPSAGTVTATGNGNGSTTVTASGNLLSEASGGDGTLRVASIFGKAVPVSGILTLTGAEIGLDGTIVSLTVNANGQYSLVAARGAVINSTLAFTVVDQDGDVASATLQLAIENADILATVPGLAVDALSLSEDGTGRLVIRATNNDPDSERLTVTATIPTGWTVTDLAGGTLANGVWTRALGVGENLATGPVLQPPANWNGSLTIPVSAVSTETNGGAVSNPASANAAVTVSAVNDAPTISASGTGTVSENLAAGAAVAGVTLSASDPEGNPVRWEIVSGNTNNAFAINTTTGAITTTAVLNREAIASYDLVVRAVDSGGLTSGTQTVRINVADVNEAPTISASGTGTVSENLAAGAAVAGVTLSASDPEGNPVRWEIVSGNTNNAFAINPTTGALTTTAVLNREAIASYDLVVRAVDSGGLASGNQTVRINVADVNEAPTIIYGGSGSIDENKTSIITNLLALDPEGDTITWSLSGRDASLFTIDVSGNVRAAGSGLDYEKRPVDGYQVNATATANGASVTKALSITVNNVDEIAAITGGTSGSINENSTSIITTVQATDPEGAAFTWSLSGRDASLFTIDVNGNVRAAGSGLNYETKPADGYKVDVTAIAGNTTATTALKISVNDVNEAPTISTSGTGTVSENLAAGAAVAGVTLSASDPEGNPVRWEIVSGNTNNAFAINAETGAITTTAVLNREAIASYDLVVRAVDSGGLTSGTQTVRINVADVNEAPTISASGTGTVSENLAAGAAVAGVTLSASDPEGNPVRWEIVSGNTNNAFAINAETGAITTTAVLNREAIASYDLVVRAVDSGGLASGNQTVRINVADVNEAPTIIYGGSGSIDENKTSIITNLLALDPEGDTITWSLSGRDASLFTIDVSGNVRAAGSGLDYEKRPVDGYQVNATATANGASVTKALSITVNNVDEIAAITGGTSGSINENSTSIITTVQATDPEGAAFTWSLSGRDASLFTIDVNGNVRAAGSGLNYETKPADGYKVDVTAIAGNTTATTALKISVNDVNEAPTISTSGTGTVSENLAAGAAVAGVTLSASDPEGNPVRWEIVSGNTNNAFAINTTTGAITTTAVLNREAIASYDLVVRAVDSGGLTSGTQTVRINVADVNEAPTISASGTGTVSENLAAGAAVAGVTLSASDPEGNPVRWEIVSGNTNNAFAINAETGAITTTAVLNREAIASYDLVVRAVDSGGLASGNQTVRINVGNVNESPVITSFSDFSLDENASAGTGLRVFEGSDPDQDNSINYEIVGGTGRDMFTISADGTVRSLDRINYEAMGTDKFYTLDVQAVDSQGLRSDARTIRVNINDMSERPVINSSTVSELSENRNPGQDVFAIIRGSDPENNISRWEIVGGTGQNIFTISKSTTDPSGIVRSLVPIDYEAMGTDKFYTLDVRAVDSSGLMSDIETIYIDIKDVNEAPVLKIAPMYSVMEDAGIGETLTPVGAAPSVDDPEKDPVVWSIASSNAGDLFQIDSKTGVITVKNALNAESVIQATDGDPFYTLMVRVSDSKDTTLYSEKEIKVIVGNVNEAPTILSGGSGSIDENNSADIITTLEASDPERRDVTWRLVGRDADKFTIDTNGHVRASGVGLDFETRPLDGYQVQAIAQDEEGLDSSPRTISITVNDVNEDAPIAVNANRNTSAADGVYGGTDTVAGSLIQHASGDGGTRPISVTSLNRSETQYINTAGEVGVVGQYGTLWLHANGTYDYQAVNGANGTDRFTFTLSDTDGSQSVGNLVFNTSDGAPMLTDGIDRTMGGATASVAGWWAAAWSSDGGNALVSVHNNVTGQVVTPNAQGNIVIDGRYGTLTLDIMNYSGDNRYTYQALNGAWGDETFTVTMRDADGDTDTSNMTFRVRDSLPVAQDDHFSGVRSGNIFENDTASADGGTRVYQVGFATYSAVVIPENGFVDLPYNGTNLRVYSNGDFTFTSSDAFSGPLFSYTLIDNDGDVSRETFVSVDISSLGPILIDTAWAPSWVRMSAFNPDGSGGSVYTGGFGWGGGLGFGVRGGTGGPEHNEIGFMHDSPGPGEWYATGKSEKLVVDFSGNTASSADVKLGLFDWNVFTQEYERGHWAAYRNGSLVAESDFTSANGDRITINPGSAFDRIEFTSLPTINWTYSYDSSDYNIQSITLYGADSRGEVRPTDQPPVDPWEILPPLILDLNLDDQISLISIDAGIKFDMTNDGILDRTGWVGADDGHLAIDLNGNGIIDNQHELFGSPAGSPLDINGFTELATYDENADGKVSSMDSVWSKLVVWQDLNQDGISQSDEMKSVMEYEIASIDTTAARVDQTVAGNKIYWDGNITMNDGSSMDIVDAYYQVVDGAAPITGPDTSSDTPIIASTIIADPSSIDAAISATLVDQLSSSETSDIDAAIHEFLIATGNENLITAPAAPIETLPYRDVVILPPETLPYDDR